MNVRRDVLIVSPTYCYRNTNSRSFSAAASRPERSFGSATIVLLGEGREFLLVADPALGSRARADPNGEELILGKIDRLRPAIVVRQFHPEMRRQAIAIVTNRQCHGPSGRIRAPAGNRAIETRTDLLRQERGAVGFAHAGEQVLDARHDQRTITARCRCRGTLLLIRLRFGVRLACSVC